MSKSLKLHGIVLHAYNVGEADRFCLILTKEKGLIPARARGVRKMKSRMGGSILPFNEIQITAHDGSAGIAIQDCAQIEKNEAMNFHSYLCAGQCADTLLVMLEDDHPVPKIFSSMQTFLEGCRKGKVTSVLPFTVRLLFILGLLPLEENHRIFLHLSDEERNFLKEVKTSEKWMECALPVEFIALDRLCNSIVENHSNRPLKAKGVARSCIG